VITRPTYQHGFTLIEMIVAIAVSAVVVIFAAMFIAAPVDAYEAHSRRTVLAADAATAWPRMQLDLRQALPNSVRVLRNATLPNFVALEMLAVVGEARYMQAPSASFRVAGTTTGIFANYLPLPGLAIEFPGHYLSINNLGPQAYSFAGTMTPPVDVDMVATATPGEVILNLSTPPALGASPRRRIYLVSGPVTYLCDEAQGTLRRYSGYVIAANQDARDEPAEFAGATTTVVARGLSGCNFAVSPVGSNHSQTVAVRLTATRDNESVTMLHTSRAEYAP
jgi:MSHA biogenesis protein MshO